jgi:3-oxoacyl-(acyl-carrier-protein) reductase
MTFIRPGDSKNSHRRMGSQAQKKAGRPLIRPGAITYLFNGMFCCSNSVPFKGLGRTLSFLRENGFRQSKLSNAEGSKMENINTSNNRHENKDLQGKTCLVTGGSRGIGRAIVTAMVRAGANVAFTYQSSKEPAEALASSLTEQEGVRCKAYQANVASIEEMQNVVKQVENDFGPITILVNNAGITRDKSFLKMTKTMWDEVMRVNLDGVFYTTQLVANDMVGAGWGRIINISSIVGQTGNFGQANYAATKGAIISLTESLARELARKGVTVNAVAPGFIETDMMSNMPEAAVNQVKALTPMGRLGKPEEIADAVVFLASPRASYVTGQVLGVNGGMYM